MSAQSGPLPHEHTDCSEVRLRVYEYIDREMGEVDCGRIRAHLEECGECLTDYERDVLLKALVRRSCGCEAAPERLRTSIMTRITMFSVEYREG